MFLNFQSLNRQCRNPYVIMSYAKRLLPLRNFTVQFEFIEVIIFKYNRV